MKPFAVLFIALLALLGMEQASAFHVPALAGILQAWQHPVPEASFVTKTAHAVGTPILGGVAWLRHCQHHVDLLRGTYADATLMLDNAAARNSGTAFTLRSFRSRSPRPGTQLYKLKENNKQHYCRLRAAEQALAQCHQDATTVLASTKSKTPKGSQDLDL